MLERPIRALGRDPHDNPSTIRQWGFHEELAGRKPALALKIISVNS